jgi:hypothetical protein
MFEASPTRGRRRQRSRHGMEGRTSIGGVGDSLSVQLDDPLRTDHLRILATDDPPRHAVDLHFDGGPSQRWSSMPARVGTTITFPAGSPARRRSRSIRTRYPAQADRSGSPSWPGGIKEPGRTPPHRRSSVWVRRRAPLDRADLQNGDQTRPKRGRDRRVPDRGSSPCRPPGRSGDRLRSAQCDPRRVGPANATARTASKGCGGILRSTVETSPFGSTPATSGAGAAPAPNVIVARRSRRSQRPPSPPP